MRVAGVTIPDDKRVEVALTYIYGIGRPRSRLILAQAAIDPNKRVAELVAEEENAIRKFLDEHKIEGVLKREVSANIKRLVDVKSYRGSRHAKRLPARGQRTKTNSRTRRGNVRKTMSSGRRKVEKK
jgi:small subunit ribosomal protein S13